MGMGELRNKLSLHVVIGFTISQVTAHFNCVQGRQFVFVFAWLQHKRRWLDAFHNQSQGARARLPIVVLAVDQRKVLLHKRTFGTAKQVLVDDLALAKDVF
jgi:hypothetical protein